MESRNNLRGILRQSAKLKSQIFSGPPCIFDVKNCIIGSGIIKFDKLNLINNKN